MSHNVTYTFTNSITCCHLHSNTPCHKECHLHHVIYRVTHGVTPCVTLCQHNVTHTHKYNFKCTNSMYHTHSVAQTRMHAESCTHRVSHIPTHNSVASIYTLLHTHAQQCPITSVTCTNTVLHTMTVSHTCRSIHQSTAEVVFSRHCIQPLLDDALSFSKPK